MEYRNYKEEKSVNLSKKDADILVSLFKKENKINIIEACETLEYEITGDMIDELNLTFNIYGVGKMQDFESTTISFYTDTPDEIFSKALQNKFEKFKENNINLEYTLVALAYSKRKTSRIKQKKEGLTLKRTKLPKYIAFLIQHSELINCTNIKEIENFSL